MTASRDLERLYMSTLKRVVKSSVLRMNNDNRLREVIQPLPLTPGRGPGFLIPTAAGGQYISARNEGENFIAVF